MFQIYEQLNQLNYFSTKQVIALGYDKNHANKRLQRELKKGMIYRISSGIYITKHKQLELQHTNKRHHRLSYIACNVVYPGAVISHETALARYQIIPEMITGIVCVTTKKTRQASTQRGVVDYRTLTKQYRGGYTTTMIDNMAYHTATAEKALFDRLWWRKDVIWEDSWFEELRLEFDLLDYTLFTGRVEQSQSPKMHKVLLHLTRIRGL